jgi:hypothetical protein
MHCRSTLITRRCEIVCVEKRVYIPNAVKSSGKTEACKIQSSVAMAVLLTISTSRKGPAQSFAVIVRTYKSCYHNDLTVVVVDRRIKHRNSCSDNMDQSIFSLGLTSKIIRQTVLLAQPAATFIQCLDISPLRAHARHNKHRHTNHGTNRPDLGTKR